jgi:hypothetical protein
MLEMEGVVYSVTGVTLEHLSARPVLVYYIYNTIYIIFNPRTSIPVPGFPPRLAPASRAPSPLARATFVAQGAL